MSIAVENLVALENANEHTTFLGNLVWYTINDLRVPEDVMKSALESTGLEKNMPRKINPRDAFRRASTRAGVNGMKVEEGVFLNLMVREVKQDKDEIVRQLVRELVDGNRVRLEYEPIATMTLHEQTGFHISHDTYDLSEIERGVLQKISDDFLVNCHHYDGNCVRGIVNDVLGEAMSVAVRPSGGVNFVPQTHTHQLDALKDFIEIVSAYTVSGNPCKMWRVPVINAEEQRDMVRSSLEDQVTAQADSLMNEMADALSGSRKITQKFTQNLLHRAQKVIESITEYESLLESKVDVAQSRMELVKRQVMSIMERVELDD